MAGYGGSRIVVSRPPASFFVIFLFLKNRQQGPSFNDTYVHTTVLRRRVRTADTPVLRAYELFTVHIPRALLRTGAHVKKRR